MERDGPRVNSTHSWVMDTVHGLSTLPTFVGAGLFHNKRFNRERETS